jgi:hypothetical protein
MDFYKLFGSITSLLGISISIVLMYDHWGEWDIVSGWICTSIWALNYLLLLHTTD